MYGHHPCGSGHGSGCGYGQSRRRGSYGRSNYGGSTFILIVVLFILLIIVGATFV